MLVRGGGRDKYDEYILRSMRRRKEGARGAEVAVGRDGQMNRAGQESCESSTGSSGTHNEELCGQNVVSWKPSHVPPPPPLPSRLIEPERVGRRMDF